MVAELSTRTSCRKSGIQRYGNRAEKYTTRRGLRGFFEMGYDYFAGPYVVPMPGGTEITRDTGSCEVTDVSDQ
eukprot:776915-Amphidinium_carterae.1